MSQAEFTHLLESLAVLSPDQLHQLRRQLDSRLSPSATTQAGGAGLIGALRDDAALLDQAVEHAMKVREERPWRLGVGE